MGKIGALPGYYAASSGSSLPTFRDKLSGLSSRDNFEDGTDLEDGTESSHRNVGTKLPLLAT